MDQFSMTEKRPWRLKDSIRLLCLLAAWTLSWWLIFDGFSYGLAPEDPDTGRERGCYTAIEDWIGVKTPTPIRTLEQLLGGGCFLGVPMVLVIWYYYRKPLPRW